MKDFKKSNSIRNLPVEMNIDKVDSNQISWRKFLIELDLR